MGTSKPLKIEALAEIDALIGRYITCETPRTYWEDSHAFFRFDTKDEAIEAIRNPTYQMFVPRMDWETSAVKKVECYPPYSSDLGAAWQVVEIVSNSKDYSLRLHRNEEHWAASFDEASTSEATSAALAICLAALRTRGIEVFYQPSAEKTLDLDEAEAERFG